MAIFNPVCGSALPSGCILIWSGAVDAIPNGFVLCDGQNNTPDLRNKFVLGAGSTYAVDATGGEATHTLTANEMPSHTHTFNGNIHTHSATVDISDMEISEAGTHSHPSSGTRFSTGGSGSYYGSGSGNSTSTGYSGEHTHTIQGSASATIGSASVTGSNTTAGGSQPHNNLPPYYALCYIMKV